MQNVVVVTDFFGFPTNGIAFYIILSNSSSSKGNEVEAKNFVPKDGRLKDERSQWRTRLPHE